MRPDAVHQAAYDTDVDIVRCHTCKQLPQMPCIPVEGYYLTAGVHVGRVMDATIAVTLPVIREQTLAEVAHAIEGLR